MSYKDYVKKIFSENDWIEAADSINKVEGKKVLLYSHDDPDGLTSAAILKRLVELKGGTVKVFLPDTYELEEKRLKKDLAEDDYSMVILADKGTMGYYGDYASLVDDFLVVDHHPPIGIPEGIHLINPNLKGYNSCSTSFLAHMLMEYHGEGEAYDDYLSLLGLKGDWAVEPATDFVSPYVTDFYEEKVKGTPLSNLVEKIQARPTMFEVNQRAKTTLINQLAELYFALGGGGFQYFYNDRDSSLKDLDHALFSFEVMEAGRENFDPSSIESLDSYIDSCVKSSLVRKIYDYFLEDWDKVIGSFSTAAPLSTMGETELFLFLGYKVPLMPMAGSVYLAELEKISSKKNILFIMINKEAAGGVHFSLRGTDPAIHAGKICANLSARLVEKYGNKDEITGGGHFVAAECKTRNSGVTLSESLEVFAKMMMDMEGLSGETGSEEGISLGLEYLAEK